MQNPNEIATPAQLDDLFNRYWGAAAADVENLLYTLTDHLFEEYNGGTWHTSQITIYNASYPIRILQGYERVKWSNVENQNNGETDAFSFSLAVNLMTASHASFHFHEKRKQTAEQAIRLYYALRDFIFDDDVDFGIDKLAIFQITD